MQPFEPARQTAKEISIEVNGLKYAAKRWGDPQGLPILALHGWLDNAASFDLLAPHLPSLDFIALDMAGHGHSGHRPSQLAYHIWEDLPDLVAIADYLGWDQFILCGHSRGAVISTLLAAACPERIRALLLLDGFIAEPLPSSEFAKQLKKSLSRSQNQNKGKPRRSVFVNIDDAVASRCAVGGMAEAAARLIVERGLQPCDGGYTWCSDSQLLGVSAVKLSGSQWDSVLRGIEAPGLLLLAEYGVIAGDIFTKRLGLCPSLQVDTISGEHHFHMNPKLASQIAGRIEVFLASLR